MQSLARASVRYLIVGGLAAVAHGQSGFTTDVGLVLAPDGENLRRAVAGLEAQAYSPCRPVAFAGYTDAQHPSGLPIGLFPS